MRTATLLLYRKMPDRHIPQLPPALYQLIGLIEKDRLHIPERVLEASRNQYTQLIPENPPAKRQSQHLSKRIMTRIMEEGVIGKILHRRLIVGPVDRPRRPVQARTIAELLKILRKEIIGITQRPAGVNAEFRR